MPNEKNLIPFDERTENEQRKIAASGGIASGAARRRKKSLKEAADLYLSLPLADKKKFNKAARRYLPAEDIDNQMAMIIGLTDAATAGDARAAKVLVGNIGGDNTAQLFGQRVHVLGADNKKYVARIQGMTIEYAYGDEMTTWHEDVFQMLKSRLRCAHSAFDGTGNPDNPRHFIKQFIDSDADVYCQTSTIDDNPHLPPKFVTELKKEYAGTVYYNRFILGQWCAAEGIIYRAFADSVAAGDGRFSWPAGEVLRPWRLRIGVDFGGNGSHHAFVAVGILPGYAGVIGLASERIDAKNTNADFLCRRFVEFAPAGVKNIRGGAGLGMAVFSEALDAARHVDLAFDNYDQDIYLGGKKVFYDRSLTRSYKGTDGQIHYATPDALRRQQFFNLPKADGADPDKPAEWHEYNPALRVDDNSKAVQDALDYFSFLVGLGTHHYQFAAGTIATATQYNGDRQDLVRNANRHQIGIEAALIGIFRAMLWAGKNLLGAQVDPDTDISINWDDSYITDAETRRARMKDDAVQGFFLNTATSWSITE